ncbi:radical SAM/SPASM domain-containing protein [Candidatus Margulisiibacteriota bacterium]
MSVNKIITNIIKFIQSKNKKILLQKIFQRTVLAIITPKKYKKLPKNYHVEISTHCNLQCEYCMLKVNNTKPELMSFEKFKEHIAPYLKYAHCVGLSGLAEPLLNKDFFKFVEHINSINKNCCISIFTNALLLNEKTSEKLVEAKLDQLLFSIDTPDQELNDKIRKGSDLNKIIQNIKKLQEIKQANKAEQPYIYATTVLQKKNYQHLPDLIQLLSDLKINKLFVNSLEPYQKDNLPEILFLPSDRPADLDQVINKAQKLAEEKNIDLKIASQTALPASCDPGTPFILPNGDITVCAVLAYARDYFFTVDKSLTVYKDQGKTTPVIFGNIFQQDFEKIWFDDKYQDFREKVRNNNFPPECQACLIKHNIICA